MYYQDINKFLRPFSVNICIYVLVYITLHLSKFRLTNFHFDGFFSDCEDVGMRGRVVRYILAAPPCHHHSGQ